MNHISHELKSFSKLSRSKKDSYLVSLGEINDFQSKRLFQEIVKTASNIEEIEFYKSAYNFKNDMNLLTDEYLENLKPL